MRKLHIISLALLMVINFVLPTSAQTLSDEAQISLLTCSPGKEFYFHFGHSAIRIKDPAYVVAEGMAPQAIDWTFNYGIFDFNTKGFYWKFIKGETDYMLGLEYTSSFLQSSASAGRTVYFQPLVLTQEQKQQIFDALIENYKPENRFYRYNFVYDNCATRPWYIIKNTLELPDPEGNTNVSWRHNIDHFSGKWSWGKFGINLVFGYESDKKMSIEQSLFLPENLMNYVSQRGDLTEDEYIEDFTPRDASFWTSPELLMIVLFILIIGITLIDIKRGKQTWVIDLLLYILYFVLGLIVFFLFAFSVHPFVGSNINVLFINPLWIVPIVLCCFQKGRDILIKLSPWMLGYLVVVLAIMLFKGQSLHLMMALVTLQSTRLFMLKKKK